MGRFLNMKAWSPATEKLLHSFAVIRTTATKNTVKDINVSDSDNKEFPDKYSVQYDLETVDTRALFQKRRKFRQSQHKISV